ncbi:MAG: putative toxin-antitoxin system toxin component, PIN family [Gammaproteobacteria bacterium]|nr:putative toxin-antitoxin system toxin component, PIN family [Gammaproteobacteria bacterium]
MTASRVVLDTNVLVSALVFRTGNPAALRTAWLAERIRPMAGHETASELIRVLTYPKFQLTDIEREELLAEYLPWCETITVPADIVVPEVRDPNDLMFLRLALAGEADALVTGDQDLLSLMDFPVPIVTPVGLREMQDSA